MPYLDFARLAVLHVRNERGLVSTNIDGDRALLSRGYGTNDAGVDAIAGNAGRTIGSANDIVADELLARDRALYVRLTSVESPSNAVGIRAMALASTTTLVGNCEAQSAIAFDFLARFRDGRGLDFPIEMMSLSQRGGNGDDDQHVFVVIGRRAQTTANNPETWNPEAVICDPWAGAAYRVSELAGHATDRNDAIYPYARGLPQTGVMFRLEGNARWAWDGDPDAGPILPTW